MGWAKDGLYYYETALNPLQYSYAGMYDIGNPLILGGKSKYSGMANFIEWIGDTKPSLVYFSNKEGQVASEEEKVPLYSKDNRVIFLQWGPRPLVPGKQELLIMAIGMADGTTKSAVPLKPEVRLDPADARFLFQ